jgi:hypothetical protein
VIGDYYYGSRSWLIGVLVVVAVGFVWKLLTSGEDDSDDEG